MAVHSTNDEPLTFEYLLVGGFLWTQQRKSRMPACSTAAPPPVPHKQL